MNKYSTLEYYYENIPTQETLDDEDLIIIPSSRENLKSSSIISQKDKKKPYKHIIPREFSKSAPEIVLDPTTYLTSKHIFLDEYCRNAIKIGEDIKKSRPDAIKKWIEMKGEERIKYEKLANNSRENFIEKHKSQNLNRINSYNLFIRDKLAQARNDKSTQTISDCAKQWKNSSQFIKDQYAKYALILRQEYSQELEKYIKDEEDPKIIRDLSWGPFRFFIMELSNNKVESGKDNINRFVFDAAHLWDEMEDEEKDKYITQASEEKNEHIRLKWEFVSNENKKNKKPRSAFNIFCDGLKSKIKIKDFIRSDEFEYYYNKWILLKENEKNNYLETSEKEKIDYQEEMTEIIKKRDRIYKSSLKEKYIKNIITPIKRKHSEGEIIEEYYNSKKGKYVK